MGLMGCTDDSREAAEPVPVVEQQVAIAFSGSMGKEQEVTRAETPLKDKANTFSVYGFKDTGADTYQQVFPGYRVQWRENTIATSTTNSDGWEYVGQQIPGQTVQTIKYWDYGATAYRFMGVTGSNVTGNYGTDEATGAPVYKLTFTADCDNEEETPYYSHLWYREISSPDIGKAVKLEFLKPFSKVRFKFIFEDPDDAATTALTDKSFGPTGGTTIKRKGKVTVTYPLTGTATTEMIFVDAEAGGPTAFTQDYYGVNEVEKTNGVVTKPYYGADENATGIEYTVIPTPGGQESYTLIVDVNGDPKTAVVPAAFMTWQPGYIYTYIFKVHVDGTVTIDAVQSAFTPWSVTSKDHTVYNW